MASKNIEEKLHSWMKFYEEAFESVIYKMKSFNRE